MGIFAIKVITVKGGAMVGAFTTMTMGVYSMKGNGGMIIYRDVGYTIIVMGKRFMMAFG
jgi:hypothetical protein